MTTTPLTLVFLGALATLATIGMMVDMDTATQLVVSVLAAVTWAITGNAALDVMTAPERTAASEPVWGVVYVSVILALATGAFALLFIIETLGRRAGATQSGGLLD
jgi:hypothetical protein